MNSPRFPRLACSDTTPRPDITPRPQRQLFYIVASPLVEGLRTKGSPIFSGSGRLYPDGSLWSDDLPYSGRLSDWIRRTNYYGAGSTAFRPLAPFGGDQDAAPQYVLQYPAWYAALVSESTILNEVGPREVPVNEWEHDLAHLRVTISIHKKMSKATALELAEVVRDWHSEIGSKGVFDERGVSLRSSLMHCRGRKVGFEIDASNSGQETLNSLVLAALNWGMSKRLPLHTINLAAAPDAKVFASDQSVPLD